MIEKRVRIVADCDPLNPRTDWDCHAGKMVCWHSRYNLGDDHSYDSDDFLKELAFEAVEGLEERVERLDNDAYERLRGRGHSHESAANLVNSKIDGLIESAVSANYLLIPLYLYDHSGITMSTGSFGCRWDSCQVGWIFCNKDTIDREFNGDWKLAAKAIEAEVEVYDQYLTGDVYGFIVEERETDDLNDPADCDEGWDETDSCWGFFGRDVHTNGMTGYIGADLVESAASAEVEYPPYR